MFTLPLTISPELAGWGSDLCHFKSDSGLTILSLDVEFHEQMVHILWVKSMNRARVSQRLSERDTQFVYSAPIWNASLHHKLSFSLR
jgi:hypothetical protein